MSDEASSHAGAPGRTASDDGSLRVVIAYDDLSAYRQALRALVSLIPNRYHGGMDVSPSLWRFGDLARADLRPRALTDVAGASVLVVSMSADGPLPPAVQAWLPACLGQRSEPVSSVVVLVGGPGGQAGPESQRYQFVWHMARMAGWEFIALTAPAGAMAGLPAEQWAVA